MTPPSRYESPTFIPPMTSFSPSTTSILSWRRLRMSWVEKRRPHQGGFHWRIFPRVTSRREAYIFVAKRSPVDPGEDQSTTIRASRSGVDASLSL
ncbi:MAG: hypothetical protein DYH06_05735 [Acidobacteria bacterium ACB2]|nr:hypothetical protein [Acidobacteria bacterium ACB2]